jgi:hypothetical protein
MAKYRMDIFKPGHPTPLLWRRRDIYASDDATAKTEAEELYCAYACQRNFDELLPLRQHRKIDLRIPRKRNPLMSKFEDDSGILNRASCRNSANLPIPAL